MLEKIVDQTETTTNKFRVQFIMSSKILHTVIIIKRF